MWENCWYYLLHAIIKTRFYLRLAMNQDRSAIHELQRVQQQTGKDQDGKIRLGRWLGNAQDTTGIQSDSAVSGV